MPQPHAKPRLLFFQFRYDERLPAFLLAHKREHVKCLEQFFDVTVIDEDGDYLELCDRYEPDLALFESGVNHETCRRLRIDNVRANPRVTKAALHNADSFCNARAGFLSDMDHWGIETVFAISTTAAEHTPEIADRLFTWPNFVDPDVFRDYGGWKSIPVLLTGNTNAAYPWRRTVFRLVSARFPALSCPHGGYAPGEGGAYMLFGEQYARTINASWCVPTCGTVAKDVVRKHLEVPACNACLVTEDSPTLRAAGFVDMKNCVFADEHDVLDKLEWLFRNPDSLASIAGAGRDLVHARHTLRERDQILRWFELTRSIAPGERIIQTSPFEAPIAVSASSLRETVHVASRGEHLALLAAGDDKLWRGRYDEAERDYLACINYMRWMPEPRLRMALCELHRGHAKAALQWIEEPVRFILADYGAADPDPVEWAYLIIAHLCLGRRRRAAQCAAQFPGLDHPELDRARWACAIVNGVDALAPLPAGKRRGSIHALPERNLDEWTRAVGAMLGACGRDDMARALRERSSNLSPSSSRAAAADSEWAPPAPRAMQRPPRTGAAAYARRRRASSALRFARRGASRLLHALERRWGYFLPYRLSAARRDPFLEAVFDLCAGQAIATALVVGAARGRGATQALLAGLERNRHRATVLCIGEARSPVRRLRPLGTRGPNVEWHAIRPQGPEQVAAAVDAAIAANASGHGGFDLVLVDANAFGGAWRGGPLLMRHSADAAWVFVDAINRPAGFHVQTLLAKDPGRVADVDATLRDGYAIFARGGAVVEHSGRAARIADGASGVPAPMRG